MRSLEVTADHSLYTHSPCNKGLRRETPHQSAYRVHPSTTPATALEAGKQYSVQPEYRHGALYAKFHGKFKDQIGHFISILFGQIDHFILILFGPNGLPYIARSRVLYNDIINHCHLRSQVITPSYTSTWGKKNIVLP